MSLAILPDSGLFDDPPEKGCRLPDRISVHHVGEAVLFWLQTLWGMVKLYLHPIPLASALGTMALFAAAGEQPAPILAIGSANAVRVGAWLALIGTTGIGIGTAIKGIGLASERVRKARLDNDMKDIEV